MKISIETGSIDFPAGSIRPRLDRKGFLAAPIGAGAEEFIMNEPAATYRIFPEKGIVATAQFNGDVLETVAILFEMQGDGIENWTEAHELERKKIHDNWLRDEFGPPPYRYPWGSIDSSYDPRACVSDIFIDFGTRQVPKAWWQKDQPT